MGSHPHPAKSSVKESGEAGDQSEDSSRLSN